MHEEMRSVYQVLVGKREVNRPPGRPRRRRKDNIKIDVKNMSGKLQTGFIWLMIGTDGVFL
jgi:hypothetical protein